MPAKFDLDTATRINERLSPLMLTGAGGRRHLARLSKTHRRDLARPSNWAWESDIYAVAIGEKTADRKPQHGEFCLKFFVRRKLAKARLRAAERIPPRLKLPSIGGDVLTDVEEMASMPVAHAGQIFRPVRPGASVGNFRGSTGTAGLIVKRVGTAAPLILSCSHVLALGGRANAGDPIEQPVHFNGTVNTNRVGTLTPFFTTLDPSVINDVDAAVATLDQGITADPAILDLAAPTGISDPFDPLAPNLAAIPLVRSGATTGKQMGSIAGLRAKVKIQMPVLGGQVVVFRSMVLYNTHSEGGDSGAAVLDARDNSVVGLHVAGDGGLGTYLPIRQVLDALGVELF
jgi:hypothetical protein